VCRIACDLYRYMYHNGSSGSIFSPSLQSALCCSVVRRSIVQNIATHNSTAQYITVQSTYLQASCRGRSPVLLPLALHIDRAIDSTAHRTGRGTLDQILESLRYARQRQMCVLVYVLYWRIVHLLVSKRRENRSTSSLDKGDIII
jgi:hypothetical protein